MKKIAIFASGTGSNANRIIEHLKASSLAQVTLVLSNNKDAGVLDIAKSFGIPTMVIDRNTFYKTNSLLGVFAKKSIDLIVLAGFLWLVPSYLINAFPNKIINIHPALLPKYGGKGMYGMHIHRAVQAAKEQETGITIHYVNEKYDEGAIIFQKECTIFPEDTAEKIAQRVLILEHKHFPIIIEMLLSE